MTAKNIINKPENNNGESNQEDLLSLIKKYSKQIKMYSSGDIVEGTVIAMDKKFILVDIGAKSEGLIPKEELKYLPEESRNIKIGDKITTTVLQLDSKQGSLILSVKKSSSDKSWDSLIDCYETGETLDVVVMDYLKGGLVVDVNGIKGYVPISHLNRQNFEAFNAAMAEGPESETGQTLGGLKGSLMNVKVIEVDPSKNRLVMSEKEVMSKEEMALRDTRLAQIQMGDVVKGTVSTVLPYGVLVDLKGVDGLIHISEIAWEKVNDPSDYFSPGDPVEVKVIGKDDDKIALSVKELKENPWNKVEEKYPLGKILKAKVSKVVAFGAFIELEPGLDGLIHISEMSKPLKVGDEVEAIVVNVDSKDRKLALSVRQIEDAKIYR
jgi:small subunit ribosomal protein S1